MSRSLLVLAVLLATAPAMAAPPTPYPSPYADVLTAPKDAVAYRRDLDAARAALKAKQWDAAARGFRALTAAYPLDRETWTGLATAERQRGDAQASIDAYQRAMALAGPFPASARYWIAVQQAKLGQRDAAIASVRTMIEQDHELDRPGLLADPAFAALRDDPRWPALASTAGGDRVAGWRGDLDVLLAEMHRLAPAYRDAPLPAATQAAADRLRADIPALTDAQVYARMGELVGTLHMGHTLMWGIGPEGVPPDARVALKELPVMLYAFPDGLYVVQADAAQAALVGRKLVAIDGVDAARVFDRVAGATSFASPAEALWTVPVRVSDLTLLHGLGIAKRPDAARLTLADARGGRRDVELTGVTHAWRPRLPAPPNVAPPTFLARTNESHWAEAWPDLATTYVQFNQVAPDPGEDLPAFGLRLRKLLADNGSRTVVIDLRHNNGGNTFTYPELLRTLVAFSADERHRVYAVIGRDVYSAAANFTADLERLVRPVFVGEPTGMTGNQDGDEGAVVLPWSGLRATVSGVRWQLSHPWDRRTSIAPQVPVTLTAADYFAGRDPVLATVRAMIADGASRPDTKAAR